MDMLPGRLHIRQGHLNGLAPGAGALGGRDVCIISARSLHIQGHSMDFAGDVTIKAGGDLALNCRKIRSSSHIQLDESRGTQIVSKALSRKKIFLNILSHLNLKDTLSIRLVCLSFDLKICQFVVNKLPASILKKLIPKTKMT